MQRAQNYLASYWNLIGNKHDAAPTGPGCRIIGFLLTNPVGKWHHEAPPGQGSRIIGLFIEILLETAMIRLQPARGPRVSSHSILFKRSRGILTRSSFQNVQRYPRAVLDSRCQKYPHTVFCTNVQRYPDRFSYCIITYGMTM